MSKKSTKHGLYKSPEHMAWRTMRQRCQRPTHPNYSRYGGRGISVCKRWADFAAFYADMGPRPSAKHSLDRKDNDGNYEPGNCRWATKAEQNRNSSSNQRFTYNGKTATISEWAADSGIKYGTLRSRLIDYGWTIERALTAPIQRKSA